MFTYDSQIIAALRSIPHSVSDVLANLQAIDTICSADDGIKWFNWLYLEVTGAIETKVNGGSFNDPAWLALLDVQFASLYFDFLKAFLQGASCPGSWRAVFSVRDNIDIARIQFALAGMNAHINHDLPLALMATSRNSAIPLRHGTAQYADYTSVNSTIDSQIDAAKRMLNVRLPGNPLPTISHLEDIFASWNVAAAREAAWTTAESLSSEPQILVRVHMDVIDGLTTVIGKSLLVPVP
jgi:hypothetical protein